MRILGARWAACLLLLPMLAAGCLGGGDAPGTSSAVTLVEAEPGIVIASDRGALVVAVANEANLSVAGARVSVLGSDLFGDTDKAGRFTFRNVTVGDQVLLVQHESFQTAEVPVAITAGNVTRVHVNLVPRDDRGAGYVPHTHDFWGGADEFTLIDRDVTLAPSPSDATTANAFVNGQVRANTNQTWPIAILGEPDEHKIVLPGTKEMRVTFSWRPTQVTLPRIGFGYRHPAMSGAGFTLLEPKAAGGTWTLRVLPAMADSGHQKFSLWSLIAYSANSYTSPTTFAPAVVTGPLHVKVVLVRGEVTLEPPHEDFWTAGDTRILSDYARAQYDGGANPTRNPSYGLRLDSKQIVPPGTKKLRIEFRVVYAAQESVNALDWDLTWRTGSQNPQTTTVTQYSRATPTTDTPLHKVWEIDVKPEDSDAFYQTQSNWNFVPWPKPWPEEGMFLEPRARNLYFGVTAFKDPAYGDG
ncbi:MAG: carboxypeptidase regulatory-like domain-containing protein [Euryarchaeota archaeon]|nr:carboxypeptidase regulatory-like domain-containing protein [Euryarchaeota archaeon]